MPRISAAATSVRVISPNVSVRPPIPAMRITDTTKRFLLSSRFASCIILRPETAIKPRNNYNKIAEANSVRTLLHTKKCEFINHYERKSENGKRKYHQSPACKAQNNALRDEKTGTREFRILVEEVAMLMGYEAMRDLPTEDVEVKTPITTRKLPMLCGKKLAIVPILRAGLGMVSGLLALVPSAKVGHIGLYRDEVTQEPHEYYCKLPDRINERPR